MPVAQLRFSGFGGQGVVLAGVLLGEAGIMDGKYVAGSNSYGAQARGSGCKSEIVFSDAPIDYPHVITADVLVAMSQSAYDSNQGDVNPEAGLIIYDETLIKPTGWARITQIGIAATERAMNELNNKQAANIVLLGALVGATGIVSRGAVEKAMGKHVAERFRSLNMKAFDLGIELGSKADG